MYSSRGSNSYGQQQPYSSQSSHTAQNLGPSAILGGRPQETEFGGLRAHGHVHGSAAGAVAGSPQPHYGGQYNSIYGSKRQQISPTHKGSSGTALEIRSNYGSSVPDPAKLSNDYVSSSSRGYGQKVDRLYADRISEYPSIERRQYAEWHSAYLGTDLSGETISRYVDPVSFGNEHQSKMYERVEATMLRQEQVLKAHALQSASVEGGARQVDYLAPRATIRHPGQDPISYSGRIDPESHGFSIVSSYSGQKSASILGAAPPGIVDDLIYAQSSSNPGYGVSLPPGRDYGAGKGLHRSPLESDYPSSTLGHASHLRVDDRNTYGRQLELREKDHDYMREREKDRDREKERQRDRDREHERERQRDRERECERERERERERRDKEKGRLHKRGLELRHEHTPPRVSRDRQGPSLTKDIRSQRRESPRREVLNRPHSPVKEKRRDYSCKVFSFSFIEAERDYLSLDKRYPRLYISPEFSKVLVHWPKQNLQLPFCTPVSFEHDFVEEMGHVEKKEPPAPHMITAMSNKGGQTTIWNAKIILMSGLSQNAQSELLSEKIIGDRILHFCNMLRFAVLKRNGSLMALGGPWDTVDGGDPSVGDTALIRTALRYAKDVTNLDLKNCQRWNRFLEIHYQRVGRDGLSSYREVTVLYVPDLSECLPALNSWRNQWISDKKAAAKRELHKNLKKEKSGHKEVTKDKKKAGATKIELQKKEESMSSGQPEDANRKDKDVQKPEDREKLVEEGKEKNKPVEKKNMIGSTEDSVKTDTAVGSNDQKAVGAKPTKKKIIKRIVKKNKPVENKPEDREKLVEEGKEKNKPVENKNMIGSTEDSVKTDTAGSNDQKAVGAKPTKKKIIKRIVKKKVATKKVSTQYPAKKNDVPDKEDAGGKNIISEGGGQKDGLSSDHPAIKAFSGEKVVIKPEDYVLEKKEGTTPEVKTVNDSMGAEGKAKVKLEASTNEVIQGSGTKKTVKRKVVKRVLKRKAVSSDANSKVAEDDSKKVIQPKQIKEENGEEADENQKNEIITNDSSSPKIKQQIGSSEKQNQLVEKKGDSKDTSGCTVEATGVQQKVSHSDKATLSNEKQELKDKKEGIDNSEKNGSNSNANKVVKQKKRTDEPPRHPGLTLQTKGNRDSKLQSVSLSLDSLLGYSNKDLEDSNFELSVFAESFYEMLQYEMGCRLLTFLQKLRVKFVSKRKHGKRGRQESSKENESSSRKRAKSVEHVEDIKPTKTENDDAGRGENNIVKEEATATKKVDDAKIEDKIEEDPEEDPEEDEEMQDIRHHHDPPEEKLPNEEEMDSAAIGDDAQSEQNKKQENADQTPETPTNHDRSKKSEVESETKGTDGVIDKDLLQAFRFFDRNRVGYIRVEDMRVVIHNLGKFLSNRDVKELVQSALLESNTGRDDKILYEKLVKISAL